MEQALDSSRKGASWLLDRLRPDGSLDQAQYLNAYYKLPAALAATGHVVEAERVLDFVASRFLGEDGDLDGSGIPWFEQFRIYPHAWLAFAAASRGRWEIVRPLLRYLSAAHRPATGGFEARADGTQEIMTTAMGAMAALWCGRVDLALGAAGWLERVFAAQPDLQRGLYHVWRPEHGLVTEFEDERAVWYLVDARQTRQWYYQYGISAAFLSQLAAHTGQMHWLELGRRYLHACRHCREDVFRTPQAGKIGWGAAWTFRVGGQAGDAAIARAVVDGLIALQQPDGSWHDPAYDPHTCLDVTAEMTALQAAIGVVAHV